VRIFVAGSTGVLGRRLVRHLAEHGHKVVGLVRDEAGAAIVRQAGGEPREGDILDPDSLRRAAAGAEAVVHTATRIPTTLRTKPSDFVENDRVRRQGTENLLRAAVAAGAYHYVQQSIVWLAAPADGSPFDESASPNPDVGTDSALYGERIARSAGSRHGFSVAVLRCGWLYAADASHTRMLGRELARRRLPVIGRGDAAWAPLHADDAASAFAAAATLPLDGLWHVVDDEPVAAREFLRAFAERIGAPLPRHVPRFLARLFAGEYVVDFLTRSVRTSNASFRSAFGWKPRYPTYREGLDQVAAAWREEGFPGEG
jgi:2-alkyl-3-oxoalkanoate reductase